MEQFEYCTDMLNIVFPTTPTTFKAHFYVVMLSLLWMLGNCYLLYVSHTVTVQLIFPDHDKKAFLFEVPTDILFW